MILRILWVLVALIATSAQDLGVVDTTRDGVVSAMKGLRDFGISTAAWTVEVTFEDKSVFTLQVSKRVYNQLFVGDTIRFYYTGGVLTGWKKI